jgi:RNA polymerase sigma factor (sigma-70 family)
VIFLTHEEQFEKMIPWAKARARAMVAPKHLEDAEQEALLGLWKAIETFDQDSVANFKTYATTVIRNHVYDFIRKDIRQTDKVIYNWNTEERSGPDSESADELLIAYSKNIRIREVCGEISDREQDILSNRMLSPNPDGLADIARRWNTTEGSVRRDENRLSKLIRERYYDGI